MINVGLMFTERCNANCRHCSTRDFMPQGKDMPLKDAFRYIDQLAALSTKEERFAICLSGGEPFLRYPDLLAVTRYAKQKGVAEVSCVTNGFWGKDPAMALQWAAELSSSGMGHIGFSLDDFHQEYIPLDSVVAALTACRKMRLPFVISCVVTRRTRRLAEVLGDLGNLLLDTNVRVREIASVPTNKAVSRIPKNELLLQEGIPQEPCLGMGVINILPDGMTFPCCGVGWTQRLVVGNALIEPIADLIRRLRNKPLFAALQDKGPAFLAPYFSETGYPLPEGEYVNTCHLCMNVLGHPEAWRILPRALIDWKMERVAKVAASIGITFAAEELADIGKKIAATSHN